MIRGVGHLFLVAACFYFAGTAHEAGQYGNEFDAFAGALNGLVLLLLIRGAE
jgi:hypothetical protein